MVRSISIALLGFALLALLVIWILSGAPRRVVTSVKNTVSFTPSEPGLLSLPWQPKELLPMIDITDVLAIARSDSPHDQLRDLEAEYEQLEKQVRDARFAGPASPYADQISFARDEGGVRATASADEYVHIVAHYTNTAPVDITGWTIESVLTKSRAVIPPAAAPFVANRPSETTAAILSPGSIALISSGPSPVGVSFRENLCTGYLQQFQRFNPPLMESCPEPHNVLPLSANNLEMYGEACLDAVTNIAACRFPRTLPDTVSPACRAHLTEALSYNGCVARTAYRSDFHMGTWRLFLASPHELWRNSHDALRLLDREGRTVSVYVY